MFGGAPSKTSRRQAVECITGFKAFSSGVAVHPAVETNGAQDAKNPFREGGAIYFSNEGGSSTLPVKSRSSATTTTNLFRRECAHYAHSSVLLT